MILKIQTRQSSRRDSLGSLYKVTCGKVTKELTSTEVFHVLSELLLNEKLPVYMGRSDEIKGKDE